MDIMGQKNLRFVQLNVFGTYYLDYYLARRDEFLVCHNMIGMYLYVTKVTSLARMVRTYKYVLFPVTTFAYFVDKLFVHFLFVLRVIQKH